MRSRAFADSTAIALGDASSLPGETSMSPASDMGEPWGDGEVGAAAAAPSLQ